MSLTTPKKKPITQSSFYNLGMGKKSAPKVYNSGSLDIDKLLRPLSGDATQFLPQQTQMNPNFQIGSGTSVTGVPDTANVASSAFAGPTVENAGMLPDMGTNLGTATENAASAAQAAQGAAVVEGTGGGFWDGVGNGISSSWDATTSALSPTQVPSYEVGQVLNGKTLSPQDVSDLNQGELYKAQADDLNSIDWTSAFNVGLEGWNAYKKNDYNDEMLSLYKGQIKDAQGELARRNTTRSNWGSAFANAQTV